MGKDTLSKREQMIGWYMMMPALLVLGLVFIYPIGRALWLSFFTQNLGTQLQPIFSGSANYVRMFGDGRFWQSIGNTAIFTVISVTLELLLG
ncbi:MAG: carbohydrate ABC transporter permease, partial [Microcystaceae cyanobacterium]